jgi:hypothetical protein
MRSYGRDSDGNWIEIDETSLIWLATLVQTLRLVQGESPFYALYGIPAIQSIITQIAPDAAIARTQSQFAQYFASLTVARDNSATDPTYSVRAVFLDGTVSDEITVAT